MKMAVGKEAEWKKLWPMLHYSSNKSKDKKKPSKKLQSILTISECLLWVHLLQTKICDLTSLPVYQFWRFKICFSFIESCQQHLLRFDCFISLFSNQSFVFYCIL